MLSKNIEYINIINVYINIKVDLRGKNIIKVI